MHIADGIMAPPIWVLGYIIAIPVLAYAIRRTRDDLGEAQIPLLGVLAAGIFVAQMLSFPIGGGTTGHLIGAALAAILLGPYAMILIITVVLIIQALLFGDGGVTALGLNILNMAIVGGGVAYVIYYALNRSGPNRRKTRWYGSTFVAAWAAVVAGALACAAELGASAALNPEYGIPLRIAVPTMGVTHVLIGIGEGVVTVLVVAFIAAVRPEMISARWRTGLPATS
ncbi:MAG: energy-coupling factor ABC transporter permease [Halobacteriota archaeon]